MLFHMIEPTGGAEPFDILDKEGPRAALLYHSKVVRQRGGSSIAEAQRSRRGPKS
jgi:hypothetical protein